MTEDFVKLNNSALAVAFLLSDILKTPEAKKLGFFNGAKELKANLDRVKNRVNNTQSKEYIESINEMKDVLNTVIDNLFKYKNDILKNRIYGELIKDNHGLIDDFSNGSLQGK